MNLNCNPLNILVFGALMTLLSGCLSRPVQVAASSDPIEPGKFSTLGIEVSGTDTQVMFFGMTFGSSGSGLRRAIDEALGEAPGADALVRMTVDCEEFYFPFNFIIAPIGVVKTRVSGTPVKINAN